MTFQPLSGMRLLLPLGEMPIREESIASYHVSLPLEIVTERLNVGKYGPLAFCVGRCCQRVDDVPSQNLLVQCQTGVFTSAGKEHIKASHKPLLASQTL